MLKVKLITLSDYASISREGKLSINGIFDKLNVTKFPTNLARAYFVATVNGDSLTEYKLDLVFKKGTKQLATFHINSMTGQNGRNNLVIELVGLPIESDGDYKFSLTHEKKEIGAAALEVLQKESKGEEKLPN